MIIGLGDDVVYGPPDPVVEGPELTPGDLRPVVTESAFTRITPESTMTIWPVTEVKKAVPRAPGPASNVLDKILPKKLGASGKVTIWGLPPAVAYAIAAVILAGGGWFAYQHLVGGGGGRRVARNPKRRRHPRGKRARYKR